MKICTCHSPEVRCQNFFEKRYEAHKNAGSLFSELAGKKLFAHSWNSKEKPHWMYITIFHCTECCSESLFLENEVRKCLKCNLM